MPVNIIDSYINGGYRGGGVLVIASNRKDNKCPW